MRLSAAVNLRLCEDEIKLVEIARQKGIKNVDIFRRGLEAYIKDINRMSGNTVEENNT